jgi:hypothetical protein
MAQPAYLTKVIKSKHALRVLRDAATCYSRLLQGGVVQKLSTAELECGMDVAQFIGFFASK